LAPLVEVDTAEDAVDRDTVKSLTRALSAAAGVPLVAAATQQAYVHRAIRAMGWPVARWLRRLRPDPLRRLRLGPEQTAIEGAGRPAGAVAGGAKGADLAPVAVSSIPPAAPAERAAVGLAVRGLGDRAGARLPEPWQAAVLTAARSRADDLPDALDMAVASTDLGMSRRPLWWRLVGGLQWLAALTALVGLGWLAVRYAFFVLALPEIPGPQVGRLPLATLLLIGGLLFGLLLSIVVRPLIGLSARRARARVEGRLRSAVGEVARSMVVAPVREVLHAYADARSALRSAGSR
jgi:hypothetical protein